MNEHMIVLKRYDRTATISIKDIVWAKRLIKFNTVVSIVFLMLFVARFAKAEAPIEGLTKHQAYACQVTDEKLNKADKEQLVRWIYLNRQKNNGVLTYEEDQEGLALFESDKCGELKGGLPILVILQDGYFYLIEFESGLQLIVMSEAVFEPSNGENL